MYNNTQLPSDTKTVTVTEKELMALKHPARPPRNKKMQPVDVIEGEEWRVVPKTNDIYWISNLGRLRKKYISKAGKQMDFLMNNTKMANGYCVAALTIYTNYKVSTYIHRLVLIAFDPVDGYEKLDVIHLDCDTANNRLDNLKWATRQEAQLYKKNCGTVKPKLKTKEYINKKGNKAVKRVWLSDGDINKIRDLYNSGVSQIKIAEMYNSSQAFISKVVNNKLRT